MNGARPRAPLKLIYFALIASTFIYAGIIWMLLGQRTPAGTIEQELRRPDILILMLLSPSMFGLSLFLGGETRQRMIVRWAIVETSTIYGLIAAMLVSDWRLFAIGWGLSLLGFALAFPPDETA